MVVPGDVPSGQDRVCGCCQPLGAEKACWSPRLSLLSSDLLHGGTGTRDLGGLEKRAQYPGPSCSTPQSCFSAQEPGASLHFPPVASLCPVSAPQIQAVVGDSQRLRDAWGGSSWSACVLAEAVATHPSCPCGGLPLSTGSESRGLDPKTKITWLPFLLFLSFFLPLSVFLFSYMLRRGCKRLLKSRKKRCVGLRALPGFLGLVLCSLGGCCPVCRNTHHVASSFFLIPG